jgi:hypothetical protein
MRLKKKSPTPKYKAIIIGCNLMFGATEQTFRRCLGCELTRTDNECLDDIMCAERHYVYEKIKVEE